MARRAWPLPAQRFFKEMVGWPIRSELLNRNLAILVLAQVAAVTGVVSLVTIGGIVGRELAADPALSTLPISLEMVTRSPTSTLALSRCA